MPYSTAAPTGPATHQSRLNLGPQSEHVPDATGVQDFDPYNYTGARWLRNDNQQRQLRYINFDFNALSEKVLALSGAKSVTNCEKIEGVQQKTSIPIPQIFDWSSDASNTIGSEYIIAEHAPGTCLHWKWPDMTDDQRVKCIENIYQILKEVVNMDFPVYGSIYFANSLSYPSHALNEEFCIGPHCGDRYWECGITRFYHHHGSSSREPWPDMLAYSNAQIDTGLARLPPLTPDPDLHPQPSYQGSISKHVKLLQDARKVLHAISTDPQLQTPSTPTLFPDLSKRKIMVSDEDPSKVTSILGWSGSAIEPASWYASPAPDFVPWASGRPIPNGPSPKSQEDEDGEDGREREERCAKAFRDAIRHIPRLNGPRNMHENIFRPYWVCTSTWGMGIPTLHHELIELRKDWARLGFGGTCPYPEPSEEEIKAHKKEYEDLKVKAELKQFLCSHLNVGDDGWVVEENWDLVQEIQGDLYGKFLDHAVHAELEDGEERVSEREVRVIWPFDVPV